MTEFCKNKKIALSNNEELIMNLDKTKLKHKLWKDNMNNLFDYKKNQKNEEEDLIELMENFDSLELNEYDLKNILKN